MKQIPRIFLYVIIAMLGFFLIQQCSIKNSEKRKNMNTVEYLKDSISYIVSDRGEIIANKAVLVGENERLQILYVETSEKLKALAERFKTVNSAIEVKVVTEYDTLKIPYENPIDYEFKMNWEQNTPYFNISGISSNTGTTILNLQTFDTLDIVIGENKNSYVIEAKSLNPNTTIVGLDGYTIDKNENKAFLYGKLNVGAKYEDRLLYNPFLGLELGLKFKNGYIFSASWNTNRQIEAGVGIVIF